MSRYFFVSLLQRQRSKFSRAPPDLPLISPAARCVVASGMLLNQVV